MPMFTGAAQQVGPTELITIKGRHRPNWCGKNIVIGLFVYLQLLDLLTTLLGFELGASEASPFIRVLMYAGPRTGVLISKLVALGLAVACVWLGKRHVLRWANYWYAGLVLWNLLVILAAEGKLHG
jgi:hypothetical protein